jgi:hypothetical protein
MYLARISNVDGRGERAAHHPAMRSGTDYSEVHPWGRPPYGPWGIQG